VPRGLTRKGACQFNYFDSHSITADELKLQTFYIFSSVCEISNFFQKKIVKAWREFVENSAKRIHIFNTLLPLISNSQYYNIIVNCDRELHRT
jgi:hypothetical protein